MLDEFPPGLDELYDRMARQFLTSKNAEKCRQVLAVQALAYRPLSLAELMSLVESPEMFQRLTKWLQRVVELCGSFLTIRADVVYFVHPSAKDYLALSQTLQENIYQLPSLGSRVDNIEVPSPDPLDRTRYACVYWADHLENAKLIEKQDLEDGGLVHRFLENHLLHWLEALSLLKSLKSGIEALAKVLSLLQASEDEKGLEKLVYDAVRFSRHHKIGIEAAPLQVYGSGLVFSPTRSVVKKLFLKKPEWLLMTRIWDVATGGCLNVLEGHCDRVSSVAFSPNGEFAASNSYDSTTCIWHATTGVCLQTLENSDSDSHYALVAFPDDKSAILVYPHGRARAWNIATGKCVQTVQIAHSEVELDQLCLSRDGRRAAWASRHKKMIEVVDIMAGQYHETPWHKEIMFGGHRVSVALSSDGECVAAAADCEEHKSNKSYHGCRRIQMWNRYLAAAFSLSKVVCDIATDQQELFTGEAHYQGWSSMALWDFSPDSKLLVSAGFDRRIWVWEMTAARNRISGKFDVHTRREHKVKFMTLSPDGKLLGFLAQNHDFQIWDTMNNKCLGNTGDSTIELFDAVTGRRLWESLTGYKGGYSHTTFFSADGGRLASGFLKNENPALYCDIIQVLDAATGICLGTIPVASPDDMVEGLSFVLSPEGAKVATISGSEVGVRIWDIATGLRTHSIALGDTPDDAPLTFSPDCRYVAYVGNYGMIRILDLETGTQVKSLKGFWNYARSIRWERAGLLTC
ncbi:WD40-repeat-containing domain protein [Ustulina deusta]|nr:WD40-repeat-containing domain protein [Ustulina deusta]